MHLKNTLTSLSIEKWTLNLVIYLQIILLFDDDYFAHAGIFNLS